MAKTRGVNSFYWHTMVYPLKPPVLWEKAYTQEIEELYREGVGISIRLPFTRLALVFGKWIKQHDEFGGLTNAIKSRTMSDDEINWSNFIHD